MFGDFCLVFFFLKTSVNIHNICLVHSSHVASLIVSGIFKSKLCNALAGFLCDQLDALHNPINNLKDKKCISSASSSFPFGTKQQNSE